MEKKPKSESYIVQEAENIIEEFLRERESKEEEQGYQEKYERLKILSIAMGVVSAIGILLEILF